MFPRLTVEAPHWSRRWVQTGRETWPREEPQLVGPRQLTGPTLSGKVPREQVRVRGPWEAPKGQSLEVTWVG